MEERKNRFMFSKLYKYSKIIIHMHVQYTVI